MCSNVPRHTCLCVKIYLYMSLWRPENITVIVQVTNTLSSSLKECFTSQTFDKYPRLVNKPEKATCFHCLALGLQMHATTPCLFKKSCFMGFNLGHHTQKASTLPSELSHRLANNVFYTLYFTMYFSWSCSTRQFLSCSFCIQYSF